MHQLKRGIGSFFRAIVLTWYSPLLLLLQLAPDREVIAIDVKRWRICNKWILRQNDGKHWLDFLELAARQATFRNLFYFRVAKGGTLANLSLNVSQILYRPDSMLFIDGSCTIGGGLYLQHGFSTIINADLGANCWVNQQVTIGFKDASGRPRLGDSVRVSAGAKVLGTIHVGDNVTIGANAVVVKNVPANCTVVGIPAQIIRQNGEWVNLKL